MWRERRSRSGNLYIYVEIYIREISISWPLRLHSMQNSMHICKELY